ncbi:unnamed protein product, partial [Nesidiocoris tenuis]
EPRCDEPLNLKSDNGDRNGHFVPDREVKWEAGPSQLGDLDRADESPTSLAKPPLKFSVSAILGPDHAKQTSTPGKPY